MNFDINRFKSFRAIVLGKYKILFQESKIITKYSAPKEHVTEQMSLDVGKFLKENDIITFFQNENKYGTEIRCELYAMNRNTLYEIIEEFYKQGIEDGHIRKN